jgi:hypothetical protein
MLSTTTARSLVYPNSDEVKPLDLSSTFVEHRKLIESLSKGYVPIAMKLFVSLSAIITPDDYQHLGPLLWEYCLKPNVGSSSTALVSPFCPVVVPIEFDCIGRLVSC